MDKYKIVSDGKKTEVFDQDGKKLRGVTKIEIVQEAGRRMIATITLVELMPDLDIDMNKAQP